MCFVPFKLSATHILVIESYHAEYAWDIAYKKGLMDTLGTQHVFTFFQMDTKRIPKKDYEQRAESAWLKYVEVKPDIVVLGDDNALKYLGPRLQKTKTPVVYLGINSNPRNYFIGNVTNITGVLERPLLKRSVTFVKKIVTELDKVLLLFDSGATSKTLFEDSFRGNNTINLGGVLAEVQLIEPYALWQQQVLSAKKSGYNAIFIGLFHTIRDESGKHVKASEVLAWTSKHSPVPVFGFWSFSVGENKAAGGLVLAGEHQGIEAAQMIKSITSGTAVNRIRPRVVAEGRFIFSRAEVAKHQLVIPESIALISTWVD